MQKFIATRIIAGKMAIRFSCLLVLCVLVSFSFITLAKDRKLMDMFVFELDALAKDENSEYRYPLNYGKAEFCTLHIYINVNTGMTITSEEENSSLEGNLSWTKTTKQGLRDRCPNKGDGCNPYSCQEVPY